MRLNFNMYDCQPELFVKRYKRPLKSWTIDELHDLWMRTCERGAKRRAIKAEQNDKIIKETEADERGQHVVYFYHRNDKSGAVHYYNFSYFRDYKSYGVSQGHVELKTRDDKLTFILAKEKEFELGQKYHELDYMCSDLEWKVKSILWNKVETALQKKFKDVGSNIPDVFILQIGTKKYFIELDGQHRYGYSRFHLKNEYTGDFLSI